MAARDSHSGAEDFARRTIALYRTAVLTSANRGFAKPHYGSLPTYRASFLASYWALKRYLRERGDSVE